VTRPCHSIINQSFDHRLLLNRKVVNGDGFGVGRQLYLTLTYYRSRNFHFPGWYDSVYDEELGRQPCIFTSITPVCGFGIDSPKIPIEILRHGTTSTLNGLRRRSSRLLSCEFVPILPYVVQGFMLLVHMFDLQLRVHSP
jgi:hypothetical protein